MILLSGHSITPERRVPAEQLRLSLSERKSTASLIPVSMDGIGVNSWLMDDTEPGAGIVWRVSSIENAFAIDTPTVNLEHVINTLRDRILFGEVKAEDISGGETCTALEAVRYILGKQGDWQLGEFDYASVSGPYKFNGDTLYDALEKVTRSLDDAWWSYDMSSYPFTIHITRKSSSDICEMRAGRNITAVTKTVDRAGMYTRFYPIGKNDLHISNGYVSRNEDLYGIICKTEVDQSKETESELISWANERLRRHAEPLVTIKVEGMDLANATGESLDRLKVGRLCRIPLADFGVTMEERIITVEYRDKIHAREDVLLTMSNQTEDIQMDIAEVIAEAIKTGGGGGGSGGRGAATKAKEDHAWFEDTNEHVAMVAEGIIGTDADGNPNWTLLSEIIVDGTGIHQSVQEIQNENVIRDAAIEVNSRAITSEVTDRTNADSILSSKITQEANRISLVVEGTGTNATVKRAAIQAAIVDDQGKLVSTITLDSDQVYIGNATSTTVIAGKLNASDVTADYLKAKIGDIANLVVQGLNVTGGLYVSTGQNSQNVTAAIWDIQLEGPTNNVYTLKRKRMSDSDYVVVGTFSRAITSASWAWSNGAPKVTLSPQGQTFTGDAVDGVYVTGDKVWADNKKSFTQKLRIDDENGNTIKTDSLTFNVTECWDAAEAQFSLVDITLQGEPNSNLYEVTSSGVPYYQAGSQIYVYSAADEVTYYKGNGGYVYGRGTSKTGTLGFFSQNGTGTLTYGVLVTGTTQTTLYLGNGTAGYLRGDSVDVTPVTYGRNITPINSSTQKKLTGVTKYEAGTRYNKSKYYIKS